MSRRAKLLLTALFLALLGIPAAYVALTWRTADPFRFRYVGQGKEVVTSMDPFGGGPENPQVPVFIEVQNITKYPASLAYGVLIARQGREAQPEASKILLLFEEIPPHSTVRLEPMVSRAEARRLERETFEVSYAALSRTKKTAYRLVDNMKRMLASRFQLKLDPPTVTLDRFVGELTKSHTPSPASASSSAPAATSQQHGFPTDSPEGLPPPAPRVDTHPR